MCNKARVARSKIYTVTDMIQWRNQVQVSQRRGKLTNISSKRVSRVSSSLVLQKGLSARIVNGICYSNVIFHGMCNIWSQ